MNVKPNLIDTGQYITSITILPLEQACYDKSRLTVHTFLL